MAAESLKPGQLRRALRLRDLLVCGIIIVQPTAPMPVFGVVSQQARGHVVTAVLLAMAAMLLTAFSYGKMARLYPRAGSAFAYVSGEFGSSAGFLAGWAILLDYLLNPLICVVWCSSSLSTILPGTPGWAWKAIVAAVFTALNLRGIEASAKTNRWMAALMGLVILDLLVCVGRYVSATGPHGTAYFVRPFYDPATFSVAAVSTGTAIAALTYIGFDTVSTLSEEAVDPRRDILLATVLVCLITGVLAAIEVYAGQLVWPEYTGFPNVDVAYVFVARRAGGPLLFHLVNGVLLLATLGSGMGAQMGAARILLDMGRTRALPSLFAFVDPKSGVPSRNVIAVGTVSLIGAWLISYQFGAELLNFGAFLAFAGVNAAAFRRYVLREQQWSLLSVAVPAAGAAICLYIWWNLRWQARLAGSLWLVLGAIYWLLHSRRPLAERRRVADV